MKGADKRIFTDRLGPAVHIAPRKSPIAPSTDANGMTLRTSEKSLEAHRPRSRRSLIRAATGGRLKMLDILPCAQDCVGAYACHIAARENDAS